MFSIGSLYELFKPIVQGSEIFVLKKLNKQKPKVKPKDIPHPWY